MGNIKKILISQQAPKNMAAYAALTEKYGVELEFCPFFSVEPLTSREFRAQRINILDYTAIVFSSRLAIDAFFGLCDELRIKIPETMKYFCTTEHVAMYLQNHIVYRKRKIFYGDGTPESVLAQIGTKHTGEKFLITTSDAAAPAALTSLFDQKGIDYTTAKFVKNVSKDLRGKDLSSYDMIVFYNQSDVNSLKENFPDFVQGDTIFITYGKTIVSAMESAGFEIAVKAPTPEITSVAKAIETYLQKQA